MVAQLKTQQMGNSSGNQCACHMPANRSTLKLPSAEPRTTSTLDRNPAGSDPRVTLSANANTTHFKVQDGSTSIALSETGTGTQTSGKLNRTFHSFADMVETASADLGRTVSQVGRALGFGGGQQNAIASSSRQSSESTPALTSGEKPQAGRVNPAPQETIKLDIKPNSTHLDMKSGGRRLDVDLAGIGSRNPQQLMQATDIIQDLVSSWQTSKPATQMSLPTPTASPPNLTQPAAVLSTSPPANAPHSTQQPTSIAPPGKQPEQTAVPVSPQSTESKQPDLSIASEPPKNTSTPYPGTLMKHVPGQKMSSRDDVRQLHQHFKDLGSNILVDGKFGPQSQAIVREFQKQKGLSVDGIVGPDTWKAAFDPQNTTAPSVSLSAVRSSSPAITGGGSTRTSSPRRVPPAGSGIAPPPSNPSPSPGNPQPAPPGRRPQPPRGEGLSRSELIGGLAGAAAATQGVLPQELLPELLRGQELEVFQEQL